jgi:hypothetical protein
MQSSALRILVNTAYSLTPARIALPEFSRVGRERVFGGRTGNRK